MNTVLEDEQAKTGTKRDLVASAVLHVLVFGGIFAGGYILQGRHDKWGDSSAMAGAVQATMVSAIPLPPRVQPKEDNVLASERPSEAPPPPKEKTEPPPRPEDIPIVAKQPKALPKPVKTAPEPNRMETPKQKIPPPKTDPQKATSGQTGGVRVAMQAVQNRMGTSAINVTDQSFGARFGWYVRQMNQRISQQWYTQTLDPGAQGRRVYLTFRIERDGSPSQVQIVQSSGDRTLDQSAVRALERIDTLGPLPSEYSGSYINVQYYFEPSQ